MVEFSKFFSKLLILLKGHPVKFRLDRILNAMSTKLQLRMKTTVVCLDIKGITATKNDILVTACYK